MKNELPENIRKLRKSAGMRQEELGEALGVSVAAVSKWERGAAAPELRYIIALAQTFSVSTDALLGCTLESPTAEAYVEQIHRCLKEHHAQESLSAVDEALQRYPNHFPIVHAGALACRLIGGERGDAALLKRAVALYERALILLPNSGEKHLTAFDLRNELAYCYLSMEKNERAITILENNNPSGVNDALIGLTRARIPDKAASAAPYLADAFARQIESLFQILQGFALAYRAVGKTSEACEAMRWLIVLLCSLKPQTGAPCAIDKMEASCRALYADLLWEDGREDEARCELCLSKQAAERFDCAPDYDLHAIRFCTEASRGAILYDDLGQSACEAARSALTSEELRKAWEGIPYAE